MKTSAALRSAVLSILVMSAASAQALKPLDRYGLYFTGDTMRVDYFHTGGRGTEIFALDRVVADGPWPGSRRNLLDRLDLGKYFFEVVDTASGETIYSRGFASIYGEWETTPEAKETHRTFHESLRFPWPKKPVEVVLSVRDGNGWKPLWRQSIDPASRFVNRAWNRPEVRVWPLIENGPPSEKVDLVLIAEGYTAEQMPKFHADARRLIDALFKEEPFRSRRSDFNVWAIDSPSRESGVHRARAGQHRRTPAGSEYNIFDSERYLLTYENRALRDLASAAPYDFLEILANEAHYGGGGIYNFQATTSVDSAFSPYVFVHEFGHHFAALADEYYTSEVAYETGGTVHPEPWEPNVTALHDPAQLKWRDLVTPGTPLPTPWAKEEFEARQRESQAKRRQIRESGAPESEMDTLFREEQAWSTRYLASMEYAGRVGAFEGASYEAKGLYRPELDCIMFTRNEVGFCRVCRRAIEKVIDAHTK